MKITAIKRLGTDEYDVVMVDDSYTKTIKKYCTVSGKDNVDSIIDIISNNELNFNE